MAKKVKPPITFRRYKHNGEEWTRRQQGVDGLIMEYVHQIDTTLEEVREGFVGDFRGSREFLWEAVRTRILREDDYEDALLGRPYRGK